MVEFAELQEVENEFLSIYKITEGTSLNELNSLPSLSNGSTN